MIVLLNDASSTVLRFYLCFIAPTSGVFGETTSQKIYSPLAAANLR